eukprot:gene36714-45288_t
MSNQAEQKMLSAAAGQPAQPAAPASPAAPNRRVLVIAGLIALAAIGAGARMWYRSHYFVETENAYVAGHVHPVSARISGVVSKVLEAYEAVGGVNDIARAMRNAMLSTD